MPLTPLATDKFLKVGLPGTATTLSAPGYTIGNNSVNIGSTSNWSTDTPIVFAMDTVTVTNGVAVRNPGSYCEFFGIVSSATAVGSLALLFGTAQNYVAGSLTRVYIPVAGTRENMIIDGLRQDHNGKGNHQSLTDDNNNIWLGRVLVAAAVNYLAVTNAITGASPSMAAAGADTNIDADYNGKGTGSAYVDGMSPQKLAASLKPYVESGCIVTFTASTLNWAMTAGVVWMNGKRYNVAAASGSVGASKDTYFDVLVGANRLAASQTLVNTGGNIVANAANAPAVAANSLRIAYVVSGASAITAIRQLADMKNSWGAFDNQANPVYPVFNTRIVGRALSNVQATIAATGSQVSWNGMPFVVFRGIAGRTYRLIVHEPIIDGYSGTSGFHQLYIYNDANATPTNNVGTIRVPIANGGSGLDGMCEFTVTTTGLQFINMQYSSFGYTGVSTMERTTNVPCSYVVEEA